MGARVESARPVAAGRVRRWPAVLAALWAVLALGPSRLSAQECPPPVRIDLAIASQLATQRNLTLRASEQGIVTAGTVVAQAEAARRGRLDLTASYYRLNAPITLLPQTFFLDRHEVTIPGQEVADQNPYFAHLNARYPLYSSGRLQYDVRRARFSQQEARDTTGDVELTTVLQVDRAYLSAVYGRENVRVNEETLRSLQAHLASTQAMRRQGVATTYDVTRAESEVTDQEQRLMEARNQFSLALDNLRTALALDPNTPIDLQGSFFRPAMELPMGEAEATAVQTDPLRRSLTDRANAFLMAEKSIRAEARPQLDLVFFYNLVNRNKGFLTSSQWSVGAQLSQNIFDGGEIRARAHEQGSQREQALIESQGRGNDVRLAIRSAYLDLDTACSAVAAGEKSVQLAREALRLAIRRFQEGVGTSLEVLDANVNLLNAETALERAWYQLDSAYLEAHRYLGDLLQVAQCAQQATGAAGTEGGITGPAGTGGQPTGPAGAAGQPAGPAGTEGQPVAPSGAAGQSLGPTGTGGQTTGSTGTGDQTTGPAGAAGQTLGPAGTEGPTTGPAGTEGQTTGPTGTEGGTP